jgi:hypothetical protein
MPFRLPEVGEKRPRADEEEDPTPVRKKDKRVCKAKDCKAWPSFNYHGQKKGMYCSKHKQEGMEDVMHARCQAEDCMSQPVFNAPGEKKGLYCGKHKLDGMEDVKNPRCKEEGCKAHPVFNLPGEKKGLYCVKHKLDGMEDVISPRCKEEGCKAQPVFNAPGEKKGLYCGKHKLDGMEDVMSARCKAEGCKSLNPVFNLPGEKKGLYCSKHKLEDMEDVKNARCLSEWCDTIVLNSHYRGYCVRCFSHLFPGEKVSRNYRTKERAVTEAVQEHYPDFDWVYDRKVSGGCSKRRPDLACDFGSHILVVEVDEHRHEGYSCENKRLMELMQDFGMRPMVVVRFNPDAYGSVTSCWGTGKNGIQRVKPSKVVEWKGRLGALLEAIRGYVGSPPSKELTVDHLFY